MGQEAPLAVAQLWRYPVKSLLGERLPSAAFDARGLAGDRLYAVEDENGKFGSGKTTRRFRRLDGLFAYAARTTADGVLVRLPDGRELPPGSPTLDAALSERYGEPLRVTREGSVSHFDGGAVHLVTTAALRWLADTLGREAAPERFRPNLLVDAEGADLVEHAWLGAELAVGSCVLRVRTTVERCVMVGNPQRELTRDPGILRHLARTLDARFGVYADVVVPGTVAEGDALAVRY